MRELRGKYINKKNMVGSVLIFLLAVFLVVFILNLVLGLLVHFFIPQTSVFWHVLSPVLIAVVLLLIFGAIIHERYIFRAGGQSLARQLKARQLVESESTPEEYQALQINQKLAQKFFISAPKLYVLPDEVGVNALSAGLHDQDIVLIVTWGALQHLDEMELCGLLAHEYSKILSGQTVELTKLTILFSGLTLLSQWGSQVAKIGFGYRYRNKQHKFETFLVALGGLIWLFGSLGVLISRFIKFCTLRHRTFANDEKTQHLLNSAVNLQTLLRVYVHHAGSQIHSVYSESITHMCFANALSAQSWMNIHPAIQQRIFNLNPNVLPSLRLENLRKLRKHPLYRFFGPLSDLECESMVELWQSPQPLPLLRLTPINFTLKDAIKPLNTEIRRNKERPEILQHAMQTATGCREVMVAVLLIRQYREFIPQEFAVSQAMIDALLRLDARLHVQIFYDACQCIGHIPTSMARQFLTKLALIIQADGEISLLDALLLEQAKVMLGLLPVKQPTALTEVSAQIVRLIDALLHVQQANTVNLMEVRQEILQRLLPPEVLGEYEDISNEPIDLAEILHDIAGLLLRERLNILGVIEMCLWRDRIITQDEMDVLALLYWRFGFAHECIVKQMLQKNSLMIV